MQIKSKGIVNGVINDKYGKRGNMNLSIPLEFINYPKETKSSIFCLIFSKLKLNKAGYCLVIFTMSLPLYPKEIKSSIFCFIFSLLKPNKAGNFLVIFIISSWLYPNVINKE